MSSLRGYHLDHLFNRVFGKCVLKTDNLLDESVTCSFGCMQLEKEAFKLATFFFLFKCNCYYYQGPHSDFAGPTSGSTACVAIIRNNQLVVANAGDSRCVISRKGQVIFNLQDSSVCMFLIIKTYYYFVLKAVIS